MKKDKNPVQEYLSQIGWYEARIESIWEERTRWRSKREQVTASWEIDRVSGSHNQDKMGDITGKLEEIELRLDAAIDDLVDKKEEIQAIIDQVRDKNQFKVLSKVYIHGKTLEQVACEIGYTYRHVCNIHGRALQTVAAVMESEDKHA